MNPWENFLQLMDATPESRRRLISHMAWQGRWHMTKEVRALLTYARALIEKGWTKGASARNAKGASVSEYRAEACEFCTMGALRRAYLDCDAFAGELYAATDALADQIPQRRRGLGRASILQYNDNRRRTKEELLALFDAALKEP